MEKKQRIFVDMDGTLTRWKSVDAPEVLYEKGFFAESRPQDNVIQAVKLMLAEDKFEVFILSAFLSDSKYALLEKIEWLNRYLPEIDVRHRIFVPMGEKKTDYVPLGIRPDDILLDDYSKNLHEWEEERAIAIKLMNGVNGNNGTWRAKDGGCVHAHLEAETIVREIEEAAEAAKGRR